MAKRRRKVLLETIETLHSDIVALQVRIFFQDCTFSNELEQLKHLKEIEVDVGWIVCNEELTLSFYLHDVGNNLLIFLNNLIFVA